ncbi:flagellar hook-length control protein FliK [Paraburkholderia phosphatilytica]|uniref:flagellar hook-length control protein FliK n=1 Tax=Paraburkholderia phosphatilytica TaxID=2282883 RepID=UPI000E4FD2B1|nr:flagellar hook-length control protein FliK [Paraburkholderia phosphatilytica]
MSTIDTAVASALAGRIESLLSIGTPATTTQTATSALSTELPVAPGSNVTLPTTPQASSQTVLSAVALTLDAIMRSGGEATPAAIGLAPVWPFAPALDVSPLPLFDAADGAAGGAGASAAAGASGAGATATVTAQQVPVAQLAAALEQTVAETGLFYESHLSEWLNGMRSPDSLASELQNRLAPAAQQLPLDWSDGGAADFAGAAGSGQGGAAGAGVAPGDVFATARGAPMPQQGLPVMPGMRAEPGNPYTVAASSTPSLHAALSLGSLQDGSSANAAQSIAASIHPATVPIVRQQLDLLATGQFRWSGEAWPGAKFDWVVEEDDSHRQRGGSQDLPEDRPWRTRITLSLPSLGTVDAELTLTGTQLVARVQASATSASRLIAQGETFRQRLADAGIALQGLTIREIDSGPPPAAAAQAASAYARASAAGAGTASPDSMRAGAAYATRHTAPPADDFFDWDMT